MHWLIPIIFLILSFTCMIIAIILFRNSTLDIKSKLDCLNRMKWPEKYRKDPKFCTVWSDNVCRKAKAVDGVCVSKRNSASFILAILSIVLLVLFIISFIITIRN